MGYKQDGHRALKPCPKDPLAGEQNKVLDPGQPAMGSDSLTVEPVRLDGRCASSVIYLLCIRCVLSCWPAFKLQVLKGNTSAEQSRWPCESLCCGVSLHWKGEEHQHADEAVGFHNPRAPF